ncbi:MAG: peptidase domain-containing ABC transporter [Phormidesmis sp. RL_2_1]|nr:peptidase domain-containing ABC transporter [Phormidesmis sp. RL_2_1]
MKYPFVQQNSEEDCGAACLSMVTKYHGRSFTMTRIREAVGTGQLGTTLLGLRRGAEGLGLNARSGQAAPEILNQLDKIPLPAIIHWKGVHWVVLYGKRRGRYVIADPGLGIRYLSKDALTQAWANGVMLLLVPNEEAFYEQKSDRPAGFSRFLRRIWPHRGTVIQASVYAQMIGLFSLVNPFLIQVLTDDVLIRGDTDLLATVAIAVMTLMLFSNGLQLVQYNLVANLAQRLELGLTLEFGSKLMRLPLSYFETRRSGEIISRLEDVSRINNLVSDLAIELPSRFFTAVISFCLMLFYSRSLTLLSVVVALFMTVVTVMFFPILQQRSRRVLELDAENQGVLVETFKGALTFKTTAAEPQIWEELQTRYGRLANEEYRTLQLGIANGQFSSITSSLGGVILLWYGSWLVIGNELSIGQLLAFNAMNVNFVGLIGFGIGFIDDFARAKAAIQRFGEVIDATEESPEDSRKAVVTLSAQSHLVCQKLQFFYPGRVDLLQDFSLVIPGGKVTALVGRSGCGKSTLAKIIAGLHPYQSGLVRIGTYNLQDIAVESLRQQIVLIPQEAHFWSRSILENFRMGAPRATFEEIVEACRISEADEFINKLPDGYRTVLGEFGSNISGGQRQRLAIARAIVNDPPILILDESTSGLDPRSEAEVLKQLLKHRRGKTTIIISHRPSVISLANWIIMMDEGEVAIEGATGDLANQKGEHLSFLFGVSPPSNDNSDHSQEISQPASEQSLMT